MDKAHSINSKLDIGEIENIERRLRQYTVGAGKKCPIDRTRVNIHILSVYSFFFLSSSLLPASSMIVISQVTQCYVFNRKETLKCSRDVETFLNCVDTHLYRAVRSSIDDNESKYSNNKHASYAERFKRSL